MYIFITRPLSTPKLQQIFDIIKPLFLYERNDVFNVLIIRGFMTKNIFLLLVDKTVKKLKKKTYECPTCKYEWVPSTSGDCCDGGCCDNSGCDAGCDQPMVPAAEPAESQGYLFPMPQYDTASASPRSKTSSGSLQPIAKRSLSDE